MFAGTPIFGVGLSVESCSALVDTRIRHVSFYTDKLWKERFMRLL
jgi:hypothetical protein